VPQPVTKVYGTQSRQSKHRSPTAQPSRRAR
jgi:hypothetical protein